MERGDQSKKLQKQTASPKPEIKTRKKTVKTATTNGATGDGPKSKHELEGTEPPPPQEMQQETTTPKSASQRPKGGIKPSKKDPANAATKGGIKPLIKATINGAAGDSPKSKHKLEGILEKSTRRSPPPQEMQHDVQSRPCDQSQSEIDKLQEQFGTLASDMKHLLHSLPTSMMGPLVDVYHLQEFEERVSHLNHTFCIISDIMRKNDSHIRIASWNVKQLSSNSKHQLLYNNRAQSIIHTIRLYGFQLIAFQEIYEEALDDIRLSGYFIY